MKKRFSDINVDKLERALVMVALDICLCFVSFALCTWVLHSAVENGYEFPFYIRSYSTGEMMAYFELSQVAVFAFIYVCFFKLFKLYSSIWTVSGIMEATKVALSIGFGTVCCLLINWLPSLFNVSLLGLDNRSRVGIILSGIFFMLFTLISRFGYRVIRRLMTNIRTYSKNDFTNVMIVGAGFFGAYVSAQLISGTHKTTYRVKVFVDDNPKKRNLCIDNAFVKGTTEDIPMLADKFSIDEIVIAIPSASKERIAQIATICRSTKRRVLILPSLQELDNRPVISDLREININDILFREEVVLDKKSIEDYIYNKVVFITGGGGSIGSEICRQVLRFSPRKLIIFDIYENDAYELLLELRRKYPQIDIFVRIGSIRDKDRLRCLMEEFRPNLVINAAAHKHVPLMEDSPAEAVKNNVVGTHNVLTCASDAGVEGFVQISTDKAVNPTNVMGATKRITELIVQVHSKKTSMKCMAVRFGNVLNSKGSVIPLFERQIKSGGPVLVTDKNITRYFMTIPEAAQLVLQAGALGETGAIYVLDMGKPVRIYELAEKVMRYHGLEPNVDMPIQIIGLRPGEKMYEELMTPDEANKMIRTEHGRIFKTRAEQIDEAKFDEDLARLIEAAKANSSDVVSLISLVVPSFMHESEHKASEKDKTVEVRIA